MARKYLTVGRLAVAGALIVAVSAGAAHAQRSRVLAFEVATIKPSNPAVAGISIGMPPNGDLTTRGMTLDDLIQFAYGLPSGLVSGLSGWMKSERYDVVGKPETGTLPSADELKMMLRTLLSERYKLAFHKAPKDTDVYVLMVGKSGMKMKERSLIDGNAPTSLSFQGAKLPGRGVTMPMLAGALQTVVLDRPVIDQTGLRGKYDFDLFWMPDPGQFGGRGARVSSAPDAPGLFTAMQEQLGLLLDSRKLPMDAMVVDHAERPAAN